MARSIAVVGAGQAGLQLGIGLLEKGFAVTLVADRSADEVFHGRLTATAGLFATALSYEAELGLDLWAGQAPLIDGVHIDFCIEPRNLLLSIEGAFEGPSSPSPPDSAFDDPAGYFPWMADLEAARRFIAERTGRPWLWTAAKARLAVGASQAAFKLGLRSVPTAPPLYQGA